MAFHSRTIRWPYWMRPTKQPHQINIRKLWIWIYTFYEICIFKTYILLTTNWQTSAVVLPLRKLSNWVTPIGVPFVSTFSYRIIYILPTQTLNQIIFPTSRFKSGTRNRPIFGRVVHKAPLSAAVSYTAHGPRGYEQVLILSHIILWGYTLEIFNQNFYIKLGLNY